jgi:hypothetical protein
MAQQTLTVDQQGGLASTTGTSTTWFGRAMAHRGAGPFLIVAVAVGLVAVVLVPSTAAGSGSQLITFTETGLSAGSVWSVTVHGVTHASSASTITFHEMAGVYSYRVHHFPLWYSIQPASGSFTVGGSAVSITVTFAAMGTTSSIQSNFNGNGIAAGDWIWFNSVLKPASAIPSTGIILRAVGQTITLTFKNGSTQTLSVPDARIDYSAAATSGSTAFAGSRWLTTVPTSFSGNVFMAGLAYHVPVGGLPGGIPNVTWSGTFSTNSTAGTFQFHWQWAAAVYTNFTSDYNLLGVKPLHSTSLDAYHNGDQAGTPKDFAKDVIGGARGGGGANATGSYSATAAVTPKFVVN